MEQNHGILGIAPRAENLSIAMDIESMERKQTNARGLAREFWRLTWRVNFAIRV
jgi:hypothetical protein